MSRGNEATQNIGAEPHPQSRPSSFERPSPGMTDATTRDADVVRFPSRQPVRYPANSFFKRLFDLVFGVLFLVALAPVMALIALAVMRDGGAPMFRHRRIGANGKAFDCLKFRTMCVDAEARLAKLLSESDAARAEWERDFKLRDDPRVTRLGNFLRQSSLDELPQLLNVVRGDMSLVGPRPIVTAEAARYGAAFRDYLGCRPGLTGLWQISGRNDVDYDTRVELDSRYARSWSLSRDVVILARTVGVVFARHGAY